jgi:hypothetical protein
MRYLGLCALFALWLPAMSEQTAPKDWKVVKESKGACRISVPGDWTESEENSGSAVLQDASNAIAVVTSQPGQTFKPLTESMQKLMRIPKDKMFENSAQRIFYQDRIARDDRDTNAFSAMVPGKNGTCSSRVVFAAGVSAETAKKIALSLVPAPTE